MKKRIVCFGDSNTYGYVPAGNGKRYAADIRWPSKMAALLGGDYTVIEEGLSGRTAGECLEFPWKSGLSYLCAVLHTHRPIDMVIIMLGTNDLKTSGLCDGVKIGTVISEIIEETQAFLKEKQGYAPKILLVSPAVLDEAVVYGPFGTDFNMRSVQVSKQLAKAYGDIAAKYECLFLDGAIYASVSKADGLHLSGSDHIKLAEALAEAVTQWYGEHPDDNAGAREKMIEHTL